MTSQSGQHVVFKGTTSELLAIQAGQDLAEYRAERALREALEAESHQYLDLPASKWPKLEFKWDLEAASQRYALDGVSQTEFANSYPNGFIHCWVALADFDARLCHASKRETEEELWGLGSRSKLAFLIAYLRCSHPITPPLVALTKNSEFVFLGGNHRYAAAKATGAHSLPVYMERHTHIRASGIVTLFDSKPPTP